MCLYWVIQKCDCGHEFKSADREKGTFCLFNEDAKICNQELGRYRIIDVVDIEWCSQCQKDFGPQEQARVKPEELAAQAQARQVLVQAMGAPQVPGSKRRQALSTLAKKNLLEVLKQKEIIEETIFPWLVRYISALPWWLDRKALIEEITPWFAELFEENTQISLRPNLRTIGCENALDDVMVWKRDKEV
ncbi:hypothetical protein GGS26DRAFT_599977 [Hypomontagnella submonticulosa]|nr:hypothetical protein GGS26DRAFT_599977 [Hypomontagnella submonticulosa]